MVININKDDTVAINMAINTSRILSIPLTDSKSLAANVVMYRLFGIDKKFSVLCMQELAYRREFEGDNFKYEDFISEEIKKVNLKPDISINQISSTISSINSMTQKKML